MVLDPVLVERRLRKSEYFVLNFFECFSSRIFCHGLNIPQQEIYGVVVAIPVAAVAPVELAATGALGLTIFPQATYLLASVADL